MAIVLLILAAASGCDTATQDAELIAAYESANNAFQRRDFAGAQKLATEVLQLDSEFTPARILLGKIHYYSGRYDLARETFENAVDRDPENSDGRVWLSRVWGLHEPVRRQEAMELLNATLRRDGDDVEAWYLKGLLHEQLQEVDQAIAAYRAAASQGKRLALVHLRLAAIYNKAGFPEKAVAEVQAAAMLSDGDAELRTAIEQARSAIRDPKQ